MYRPDSSCIANLQILIYTNPISDVNMPSVQDLSQVYTCHIYKCKFVYALCTGSSLSVQDLPIKCIHALSFYIALLANLLMPYVQNFSFMCTFVTHLVNLHMPNVQDSPL